MLAQVCFAGDRLRSADGGAADQRISRSLGHQVDCGRLAAHAVTQVTSEAGSDQQLRCQARPASFHLSQGDAHSPYGLL